MSSNSESTLYLYTSLTAGSSHIITATSRLETILKANKIPFRAVDCATDEKARMLWGRRSKGRKLPGLVKFGNVIGDLEQIEEWNEFGELREQIEAADFAGVNPDAVKLVPPTATLPLDLKTPEAKSNPSSRASSQGRHISISEPTPEEIHAAANPRSPNPISESNISMAMRQLGAEAAAKGAQRKASGTTSKAVPVPAQTSPQTAQVPTTGAARVKEAESIEPGATAAKTPATLAAEGQTKTSTDKIESISESEAVGKDSTPPSNFPPEEPLGSTSGLSTEEQLLGLRHSSTTTKQPSRLSQTTAAAQSDQILPGEVPAAGDPETSEPAAKTSAVASTGSLDESAVERSASESSRREPLRRSSSEVLAGSRSRSHRGSDVQDADIEVIRRIEEENKITEETEPDDNGDAVKGKRHLKGSTLEQGTKPQDTQPKDADAAGVSVGD